MPNDLLSPWHLRQIVRRMVIRRMAIASSLRAGELREPEHDETPLSADEVEFGMQKGLIVGPEHVRGLRARSEPVQPGVRELRGSDDPRHPGAADPAGGQERPMQGGPEGVALLRAQRGGTAPAGEGRSS